MMKKPYVPRSSNLIIILSSQMMYLLTELNNVPLTSHVDGSRVNQRMQFLQMEVDRMAESHAQSHQQAIEVEKLKKVRETKRDEVIGREECQSDLVIYFLL